MRDWTGTDEALFGAMLTAVLLEFTLRIPVDIASHRAGRPVHSFFWFGVQGDWKEFRHVIRAEDDPRRRARYKVLLCVHYVCLGALIAAVGMMIARYRA